MLAKSWITAIALYNGACYYDYDVQIDGMYIIAPKKEMRKVIESIPKPRVMPKGTYPLHYLSPPYERYLDDLA